MWMAYQIALRKRENPPNSDRNGKRYQVRRSNRTRALFEKDLVRNFIDKGYIGLHLERLLWVFFHGKEGVKGQPLCSAKISREEDSRERERTRLRKQEGGGGLEFY